MVRLSFVPGEPRRYPAHHMEGQSRSRKRHKWRLVAASAILCIAAILLVVALLQIREALAVSGWPVVNGTITNVAIEKDKDRPALYAWHEAIVTYEYDIHGEKYIGKKIRLRPVRSKYERQLEWVRSQYPVGSQHAVYYKAAEPNIACLRRDVGIGHIILTVCSFGIFVAGLWDVGEFIARRFRKPNAV